MSRLTKESFTDAMGNNDNGVGFFDWLLTKDKAEPDNVRKINAIQKQNALLKKNNPNGTFIEAGSPVPKAQTLAKNETAPSTIVRSPDEIAAINNIRNAGPNRYANSSNAIINNMRGSVPSVNNALVDASRIQAIDNLKKQSTNTLKNAPKGNSITTRDVTPKEHAQAAAAEAALLQQARHQARLNLLNPDNPAYDDGSFGYDY